MSKSWPLAVVAGMVLAGAAFAGDEAPAGPESKRAPSISCSFTDNSQLKLKNTAARGLVGSGKTVQIKYKTADGSVKIYDFRMDSDLEAGHDVSVRVPVERGAGATCSAKVQ